MVLREPDGVSATILLMTDSTMREVRAIKLELAKLPFEVCPKLCHDRRLACNLNVLGMYRYHHDETPASVHALHLVVYQEG